MKTKTMEYSEHLIRIKSYFLELHSWKQRLNACENVNKEMLQWNLGKLENLEKNIREEHMMIIALKPGQGTGDLELYNPEEYYAALDTYVLLINSVFELLANIDSIDKQEGSVNDRVRKNIKLPQIILPKFNGNQDSWLNFRNLFTSLVIDNNQLSDVERLHYLHASLTDEALILSQTAVNTVDFQPIWEILRDRYDNTIQLVHSLILSIIEFPEIVNDFCNNLKKFRDVILSAVNALKNLKRPVEHWDDLLVCLINLKLDKISREKWELKVSEQNELPTYVEIIKFIDTRIRCLEVSKKSIIKTGYKNTKPIHVHQNLQSSKIISNQKPTITLSNKSSSCDYCQGNHFILYCQEFKALSVSKRLTFVTKSKYNLCLNCLGKHELSKCRSKHNCFVCHQRHNSLLHKDSLDNQVNTSKISEFPENLNVHLSSNKRSSSIVLATAYVLVQAPSGRKTLARAILDQCSECSIISEHLTQVLMLPKNRTSATITGVNGTTTGNVLSSVNFMINSVNSSSKHINVHAYVLPRVTTYRPPEILKSDLPSDWQNLEFADPHFEKEGRIDLLLGADVYGLFLRDGFLRSNSSALHAQLSIFGWVLTGPLTVNSFSFNTINVHHASVEESLDLTLRQFWEIEQVPSCSNLSKFERECEDHFQNTYIRLPNGAYQLKLPFLSDAPILGDSKEVAFRTFCSIEKKLNRTPDLFEQYSAFMKEYLSLSHMSLIGPLNSHFKDQNFLPHHPVIRQDSLTTKLRVVFNGSAKTSNNCSINDCLHTGVALQKDIVAIITRWRQHRYVLTSDVEKMFRQISIAPEDRHFQCILWRFSQFEPLQIYELNTITYGLRSSPFQANRVIKQLCQDERIRFPNASKCLEDNVYVDDVFFGGDDIIETRKLRDEVIKLTESAHLPLRKWASNVPELIQDLGSEEYKLAIDIPFIDSTILRVLGIQWNPSKDRFQYHVKLEADCTTKRQLLSTVSKLYDPLGWISPITIKAKILLQSLWILKIGWDDPLPPHIQKQWLILHNSLISTSEITIPRWTFNSKQSSCQLHGFCDASMAAYGAVVYLRVEHNSKIINSLLISKTRVAPLKTVSVPRLELCAATLLSDLLCYIISALKIDSVPIFCWTDSSIVLSWLQHPSYTWKVFVANRVSQIQDSLPKAIWKHVPTSQNPADLASRGVDTQKLVTSLLWWNGPSWLSKKPDLWPIQENFEHFTDLDKRSFQVASLISCQAEDHFISVLISKISSWARILRVVSIILRAVSVMRKKSYSSNFLTAQDLENSSDLIVKYVQKKSFPEEIKALNSSKTVAPSSKLFPLTPFLDKKGILRLGGRLGKSHPIMPAILPPGELSCIIIRQFHKNLIHSGVKLTLYMVRCKFWIINARSITKTIIKNCTTCVKYNAKTMCQLMGDLPQSRVEPSRIFSHTGVDYAGPFSILNGIGRGTKSHKVWVVVFVCFSVKAVYIDYVNDCSTKAFINVFRRFSNQFGMPSDLYSDNATTFKGADRELRSYLTQLQSDPELHNSFAQDRITWHFLPPSAPHFGGLWEAGVKSVKKYLKPQLANVTPSADEFRTLLSEIQGLLNSRPIAPLYDDKESYDALTPGHFLVGCALKSIPTPSVLDLTDNRLTRWQFYHKVVENFWRKWQREYLFELQTRSKWFSTQPNLMKGDLVLVRNEHLPPNKWELGRIISTHPGADGLVRAVTIKTANSEFQRPIVKLVKLPINNIK